MEYVFSNNYCSKWGVYDYAKKDYFVCSQREHPYPADNLTGFERRKG